MYPKLLFFAIWTSVASGWAVLVSHRASTLPPVLKTKVGRFARQAAAATASDGDTETATYRTVFDFANSSTIDKVERLDDAIMGGISTSTVRADKGENFARWSGVCRTDGG